MAFFDRFRNKEPQDTAVTDNTSTQPLQAIGQPQIRKATDILKKYKSGKSNLEAKLINNEQFWKLRQWQNFPEGNKDDVRPASAWLWNCIVSKHADFVDGFPSPNILPRMMDDEEEAKRLSEVVPIVLDQCNFRRTYDKVCNYKLKQGTGIYGIFWNQEKNGGLGDIDIRKIDALKIFFEPGISDIQDSANVFLVELVDNEVLENQYPELKNKLSSNNITVSKYIYDDSIDTEGKSVVVDWYYKKKNGNKTILHYCKFVGDTVLYATENDTEQPMEMQMDTVTGEQIQVPTGKSVAEKGWYEHGKYPFVFDTLFDVEGSIFGYGYTDIGKDVQKSIDLMNQAMLRNTLVGARPRYFIKSNGAVNEKEYADMTKDFVHVDSSVGDDSIRPVEYTPLHGNYINFYESKIQELKEVTGNRDVNTGGGASGVTAASAIAAMQEAGSKLSRDAISNTYNAYKEIVYFVIELMREKYDLPRYFRILGEDGQAEYTAYTNAGLVPQAQGNDFGIDMGYRTPEFDIEVTAEKASPYKKMEQNELAIQMYQLGVFAPNNADQAIQLLNTMDFNGKEKIIESVKQNGTMLDMLIQLQQIAYNLAAQVGDEQTMAMLQEQMVAMGGQAPMMSAPTTGGGNGAETRLENVRDETQERTQPN